MRSSVTTEPDVWILVRDEVILESSLEVYVFNPPGRLWRESCGKVFHDVDPFSATIDEVSVCIVYTYTLSLEVTFKVAIMFTIIRNYGKLAVCYAVDW